MNNSRKSYAANEKKSRHQLYRNKEHYIKNITEIF